MRFVIWKSKDDQFYFVAKGDDGQVMATSETYTAKASAKHAINVIMDEASSATLLDMTKDD
jgi:uncharacterized protein YegP (UPF0339 family)